MPFEEDAIVERRGLKRRLSIWRTASIALAGIALLVLVSPYDGLKRRDHLARVSLDDVIDDDRQLIEALDEIAEDEHAKALIVRIDSPGGTTSGSEETYHAIRRVAAKKPVVGVISGVGASGAYIAALATDHIVARETSITGSIGVIFQVPEISGLMDKLGVKIEQIASGPLKGDPSNFAPMGSAAREVYEGIVRDGYDWFVGLVAERRKLKLEEATRLADGRVYTGRQAIKAGLIDALGGEREAIAWLGENRKIDSTLPVVDADSNASEALLDEILSILPGKTLLPERLTLDGLVSVWHPIR